MFLCKRQMKCQVGKKGNPDPGIGNGSGPGLGFFCQRWKNPITDLRISFVDVGTNQSLGPIQHLRTKKQPWSKKTSFLSFSRNIKRMAKKFPFSIISRPCHYTHLYIERSFCSQNIKVYIEVLILTHDDGSFPGKKGVSDDCMYKQELEKVPPSLCF